MIRIGFVIDPIASLNPKKDTTLAMIQAVERKGWEPVVMTLDDLFVYNGVAYGNFAPIKVRETQDPWYSLGEAETKPLHSLKAIFMRKDPPVNMEYIYATYMLELAEKAGSLIVNKPQALRDTNEKMVINLFPSLTAPTLVTRDKAHLEGFLSEHKEIILKPMDGMGGASIFHIKALDPNLSVIIETMTDHGKRFVMAQKYLPEARIGDKRILLIDGEPVPYGLLRVPKENETRANLAAGGTGKGMALTKQEYELCEKIKPYLKERGLLFVGIDVIGGFMTELNVTSPTCARELDAEFDLDITGDLMDVLALKLKL